MPSKAYLVVAITILSCINAQGPFGGCDFIPGGPEITSCSGIPLGPPSGIGPGWFTDFTSPSAISTSSSLATAQPTTSVNFVLSNASTSSASSSVLIGPSTSRAVTTWTSDTASNPGPTALTEATTLDSIVTTATSERIIPSTTAPLSPASNPVRQQSVTSTVGFKAGIGVAAAIVGLGLLFILVGLHNQYYTRKSVLDSETINSEKGNGETAEENYSSPMKPAGQMVVTQELEGHKIPELDGRRIYSELEGQSR
ncbi:MAG: hypothetical protein MMC33_008393 [Icmadophila ericetorum]|nr:hypothetical protein [Icmadophila ericetorum]